MQRDHIPLIMDAFRLNMSICNKCFILRYRGKQPYFLTQCAHIFCQDCWQKADKQCTLCGNNKVITVELSEQLPPKVKPFFEPLAETLKTFFLEMVRVDDFRNNQLKIIMQRFIELEKKYDILKSRYWTVIQDMKILTRKCINLKFEKDKLDKKLLSVQIQRDTTRHVPSVVQTPINSNIFVHPFSSGYSSESMGLQSVSITPVQSADYRKQRKTIDGFRIPIKRKDMMSVNPYDTLNSSTKNLSMR